MMITPTDEIRALLLHGQLVAVVIGEIAATAMAEAEIAMAGTIWIMLKEDMVVLLVRPQLHGSSMQHRLRQEVKPAMATAGTLPRTLLRPAWVLRLACHRHRPEWDRCSLDIPEPTLRLRHLQARVHLHR